MYRMLAKCEDDLKKRWDRLEDETKANGEDVLKITHAWERPEGDNGGDETKANREVDFKRTRARDRHE